MASKDCKGKSWQYCGPTIIILIHFMVTAFVSYAQSSASQAQSSLPFQLSMREDTLPGYPCQDCHQDLPSESSQDEAENETELEEHTHLVLHHGGLRCLDCHNQDDRNLLRTIDHQQVDFSHMEEMCKGCHSSEFHDWTKGIHGKLIGSWKGLPQGLRCVECHDVHAPKPMALKPEEQPYPPAAPPLWPVKLRVIQKQNEANEANKTSEANEASKQK